jgi:hypothetical protein
VETAAASVRFKGRAAVATVKQSAFVAPDAPSASGGGESAGQPLPDLSWFNDLRAGLQRLENRRCLRPGEGGTLSGRLIENLRAPGYVLYQLRYGDYARSGWFDLESQFQLRAVTPFRDEKGEVRGFETAFYDLVPGKDKGLEPRFRSAELGTREGKETLKAPARARVEIPPGLGFLRMYFRSWSISGDRRIALLAARDREELETATRDFEKDAEAYCAKPGRVFCLAVPKDAVVGAELKVLANGKMAAVPIGGTVADLLRGEGVRDMAGVLPTLKMTRPFEGVPLPVEFDRSRPDILRVVLLGGETVHW